MEKLPRVTGAIAVSIALVSLVGLTTAAASGGTKARTSRHRSRYLPVKCNPAYFGVILQTGAQLAAQYNAMGFDIGSAQDIAEGGTHTSGRPIDGPGESEACRYVGTKHLKGGVSTGVREGKGSLSDILSDGEPPFPGETNTAIREYDWSWNELVSFTKKGVLRGTIEGPVKCVKQSYDGYPLGEIRNYQQYPC